MTELWDVYDLDSQQQLVKTGKIVSRDEPFPDDGYHLVAQAWVRNSKGEYLISQRSKEKGHAYRWEMTGGGAQAGETSLQAACREVREELGVTLRPETGTFFIQGISSTPKRKDIIQVWIFNKVDIDINALELQKEEVKSAMWASKAVIYALRDADLWMPWKRFDYIDSFLGAKDNLDDVAKKQILNAANWLRDHSNEDQGNVLMAMIENDIN